MNQKRRTFLQLGAASAAALSTFALSGCSSAVLGNAKPHVIVIGGGYAGATAAKYIRLWSNERVRVTLIEPQSSFISCPLSNLVLGGTMELSALTISYEQLSKRYGIQHIREAAQAIDPDKQQVRLASGAALHYDRLVVAPGVALNWETLPSMNSVEAQSRIMHAWHAGEQTSQLRRQLESMPDGGVAVITVPLMPYRCPPGPYERACQIAHYFKQHKPRSKLLVLDANQDLTSKGALFRRAWQEHYSRIIEYRPEHNLVDIDVKTQTLKFDFEADIRADVLNVLPQMSAGAIATKTGLANINQRWCEVDFLTFESKALSRVHVLGDAIQIAPTMPKSGHMANQHGKTCASAVVALLLGEEINPAPIYNNTCYSFVTPQEAVHVASVHAYSDLEKTMLPVPGAGGLSRSASHAEGKQALAWAQNIWHDMLG